MIYANTVASEITLVTTEKTTNEASLTNVGVECTGVSPPTSVGGDAGVTGVTGGRQMPMKASSTSMFELGYTQLVKFLKPCGKIVSLALRLTASSLHDSNTSELLQMTATVSMYDSSELSNTLFLIVTSEALPTRKYDRATGPSNELSVNVTFWNTPAACGVDELRAELITIMPSRCAVP